MTQPAQNKSGAALLAATVKSVAGGVWLTLLTIGVLEIISARFFSIPKPSSLYLLAVAAASMLGGFRSGLISALLVFAFSAYRTHLPGYVVPPQYAPEQTTRLLLFGVAAPAMAAIVGGLRRRNDDLLREQIRRTVVAEQAQIELQREHRIAATLQNALLAPLHEHSFDGIAIGTCYEPAWDEAEIGGDFYDVIGLDTTVVAFVVGDVSGKGLQAAAKTAEVKYTLRVLLYEAWANAKGEPAGLTGLAGVTEKALARVNQMLAYNPHRTAESIVDGIGAKAGEAAPSPTIPTLVCLTLAVLQTKTGDGQIAIAGMEPPIVVRPRTTDDGVRSVFCDTVEAGGLPLGVAADAEYTATAFHLTHGETLVITTDGVLESRRPGSPELFGLPGLCQAAEQIFHRPGIPEASLQDRAAQIVGAAKRFSGSGTLKDDACVLLVQRR